MSAPGAAPVRLPKTIAGYVWRKTRHQQALLALLAVATFLLNTAPLELQRRIVNDAIKNGDLRAILLLSLAYGGLALLQGAVKLTLNIYGAYVSENTSRSLRRSVYGMLTGLPGDGENGTDVRRGIEISMIVDEVDDVGSFVGISVAQPVQQVGILLSVLGYLAFLEPTMALLSLLIFVPQLAFVPLMQGAINRRARDRINTLREISAGIVADDDAIAAATAEQHARIGHVFALNMGIFKLKFTMNFLMNLQYHLGIAAGL
ncbi:MAG TPA: ABC transporter transmembrane domain-containing protein, partial [Candidatus Sulfotelmatobacter sp.]|nr:ABC transporter transmembrane domain-containing protein [Candidatus Sulfotelmatobacter sp.]